MSVGFFLVIYKGDSLGCLSVWGAFLQEALTGTRRIEYGSAQTACIHFVFL